MRPKTRPARVRRLGGKKPSAWSKGKRHSWIDFLLLSAKPTPSSFSNSRRVVTDGRLCMDGCHGRAKSLGLCPSESHRRLSWGLIWFWRCSPGKRTTQHLVSVDVSSPPIAVFITFGSLAHRHSDVTTWVNQRLIRSSHH